MTRPSWSVGARGSIVAPSVRISIVLLAAAAAACAPLRYEERPLDPQRSAGEWTELRLDAPALAEFARANGRADFPPASWDLEALTLAAFLYQRELDTARAELAQARAAVQSAGARPNPTLTLDPEVVPGASSPWILGWKLDVTVETAGKRGLRVEAAEQDVRTRELELYATAWRVRSRLAAAWAELGAARGAERALSGELELREQRRALLGTRLAAGRSARAELAQEELELQRAQAELEAAHTRLDAARAALAAAVGVPPEALAAVALAEEPAAEPLEAPPTLAARELGLTSRLDLLASLSEYARADAELRLELAKQVPDFQLGPGTSWDQGDNKYMLGFAVQLPLFHQNEGPIAEAQARRVAAGARFLSLQQGVLGSIEVARAGYAGALRERAAAELALERAAAEARRVERVLAAGGADRLAWLDARLLALQAERSLEASRAQAERARVALEDELQRPLARAFDPSPVAASEPAEPR